MKKWILIFSFLGIPSANADSPMCHGWPTTMAFVHLKNANITNNYKIDFDKTSTTRLASEKIGDDLYHQIHKVIFTEKSGNIITVITSNKASNQECSMSGVKVYVVNNELGG